MTSDPQRTRDTLRLIPDEVRTVREVKTYVEAIREIAGDDECAHSAEDQLWRGVLAAIAKGVHEDDAADLCAAALETSNIKFNRWCA
jgi:hypothetical protein